MTILCISVCKWCCGHIHFPFFCLHASVFSCIWKKMPHYQFCIFFLYLCFPTCMLTMSPLFEAEQPPLSHSSLHREAHHATVWLVQPKPSHCGAMCVPWQQEQCVLVKVTCLDWEGGNQQNRCEGNQSRMLICFLSGYKPHSSISITYSHVTFSRSIFCQPAVKLHQSKNLTNLSPLKHKLRKKLSGEVWMSFFFCHISSTCAF